MLLSTKRSVKMYHIGAARDGTRIALALIPGELEKEVRNRLGPNTNQAHLPPCEH